jgi:glycosyltransferase involved in cell wall biosynthesis
LSTLSVTVIAKNEEASIARCLESVSFADEIILVDSGSTDRTIEIARSLGARVTQTSDWPGFGAQFNRAIDRATQEWIFSLDADEWIEAPLAREIQKVIGEAPSVTGYKMPRRSRFCGNVVRHSGWWPDYTPRLVRRGHGRFSEEIVHPHLIINGTIGHLTNPIEHDSITSWEDANDKIERYSTAAAIQLASRGRRAMPTTAPLRGAAAFLKAYLLRAGFLDGRTGLMVAEYNCRYTYQKWHKLAHMPKQR